MSEVNRSARTGGKPPGDLAAGAGSRDRVRADDGGQALTTSHGVAVSDNQSSLKAGLRGPTLLEDFICAKKFRTSTTSAFPSASCMREARLLTSTSQPTSP